MRGGAGQPDEPVDPPRRLADAYATYSPLTVFPLLPGSGKALYHTTESDGSPRPFAQRSRQGRIAERFVYHPAGSNAARGARPIDGTLVYGGVLTHHFGHFVAESVQRLWALSQVAEARAARVLFHCLPHGDHGYRTALTPWMVEVLATFGVAPERLVFVTEPLVVARLIVPEQGRVLGIRSAFPEYVGLFPYPARARLPDLPLAGRYYLSRRDYLSSGSFFGETYLEDHLRRAGFEIVQPERRSVEAMIGLLRSAEQLVFAEGSAIHYLELAGRVRARVALVRCRNAPGRGFRQLVAEHSAEPLVVDHCTSTMPLDWDALRDAPAMRRAPTRIDLAATVRALDAFFGLDGAAFDAEAADRAERLDLLRYILSPDTTRAHTTPEQLGRLLMLLRRRLAEIGWP